MEEWGNPALLSVLWRYLMDSKSTSISEMVSQMAKPLADQLGLELWDVKFLKEGPSWYVRVFIDKDGGVDIEDCERMSRKLDEPLEELDCIDHSYCLEVCSPGIERELSTDVHLEKFIGHEVNLKLFRPDEENRKDLIGKLVSFDKDKIVISNSEGESLEVARKNISRINLKVL